MSLMPSNSIKFNQIKSNQVQSTTQYSTIQYNTAHDAIERSISIIFTYDDLASDLALRLSIRCHRGASYFHF